MSSKLKIENFNMAFGENILFTNFQYEFTPGIYAFSGPSGVGKSTLMRVIAGLEKRYTGTITLNGNVVKGTSSEIHMVHQHYMSFPWLNVLQNTLMVYKGHKIKPTLEDVEEAKRVLDKLGILEHIDKLPSEISGGQDQRLSLASAFINKWSQVVLYDEPTSALDDENDMVVVDMIKEHQKKYNTIEIIITHETHVIKGLEPTVLDFTPEFRLRNCKPTDEHEFSLSELEVNKINPIDAEKLNSEDTPNEEVHLELVEREDKSHEETN